MDRAVVAAAWEVRVLVVAWAAVAYPSQVYLDSYDSLSRELENLSARMMAPARGEIITTLTYSLGAG